MVSYSPYDNVEKKNYPDILVTSGYNDSQVAYWEPAKWVAKMRELKLDTNLLLFKTNMEAGMAVLLEDTMLTKKMHLEWHS
jgi:oligopeptidase B